ncbi:hypothetical protein FRC11_003930 [Ceratobasidium sp. 423]|nr:hypothetical protein FRC11_003930 [Ceratobasidium sp. 423]
MGRSATRHGAPRETRKMRVCRREGAPEHQHALGFARPHKHATSSDNLRALTAPVRTNVNPSPEEANEDMSGASDMDPSPTPLSPAVGRSMSNDSDGSYASVPSIPGPSGVPCRSSPAVVVHVDDTYIAARALSSTTANATDTPQASYLLVDDYI